MGYSVIGGLVGFKTSVGSKYERKHNPKHNINAQTIVQFKFEEVKAIYSQLESVIELMKNNDADAALYGLISSVRSDIDPLFIKRNLDTQHSILLKNIFSNIGTEKNYADNVRRKGITLTDSVKKRGYFARPYDFLTEDYRSITTAFVDKEFYKFK